jgi:hypothetical protein
VRPSATNRAPGRTGIALQGLRNPGKPFEILSMDEIKAILLASLDTSRPARAVPSPPRAGRSHLPFRFSTINTSNVAEVRSAYESMNGEAQPVALSGTKSWRYRSSHISATRTCTAEGVWP